MNDATVPMPLLPTEALAGAMRVALQAPLDNLELPRARLAQLQLESPWTRYEDLRIFNAPSGVLMLRSNLVSREDNAVEGGSGELTFYPAMDGSGALDGLSQHAPVVALHRLHQVLWRTLGDGLRLRRHRETYRVARAEVHLDQVLKLGAFVQIEVAIHQVDDAEVARQEAMALGTQLGFDRWGPTMIETALSRELRSSWLDLAL